MYARWLVESCYYFHLQKDVAFHLNKPETPSLKDALCQAWLRYWSSGSMHVSSMYLNQLFTAWKRRGHSLKKKLSSSLPKDTFCQVWLILAWWSGEDFKMWSTLVDPKPGGMVPGSRILGV